MPSPASRAPLVLALVAVLGVGGRMLRERAGDSVADSASESPSKHRPGAMSPLDSQIAKVERAASTSRRGERPARRSKGRSGRSQDSTSRTGSRAGAASSDRPSSPRTESTPFGALPPELRSAHAGVPASPDRRVGGTSRRVTSRSAKPSTPTSVLIVDLDRAPAAEIERLPLIGPALARRIVADRTANGPFRSLDGLQRVRGVGPSIASQLQGHVTFGGEGRP